MKKILLIVVSFFAIIANITGCSSIEQSVTDIGGSVNEMANGEATLANSYNKEVWQCAKQVVSDNLLSPTSALFPAYDSAFLSKSEDGSYVFTSYVDSDNEQGTTIRTNFQVTILSYDEDTGEFTYSEPVFLD